MKNTIALLAALTVLTPVTTFANHTETHAATRADAAVSETIHIGVNGMVCDFCAQSLKKVFLKQEAVQKVDISLEDKLITLGLKKNKSLDDGTIKKLVVDAGYEVSSIHHMKPEAAK